MYLLSLLACSLCRVSEPGTAAADPAAPLPPIVIEVPAPGATLGAGRFTASGTASVWEGTVQVHLAMDGRELARATATASAGAPARGAWSTTIEIPADLHGPATIEAWWESPRDGSPQDLSSVPVVLR